MIRTRSLLVAPAAIAFTLATGVGTASAEHDPFGDPVGPGVTLPDTSPCVADLATLESFKGGGDRIAMEAHDQQADEFARCDLG